uniref:Uncharacterized protein n=1 Tax=Arundo donax TaxID=35708 RepID=A0A0A9ATP5_ARUDO
MCTRHGSKLDTVILFFFCYKLVSYERWNELEQRDPCSDCT